MNPRSDTTTTALFETLHQHMSIRDAVMWAVTIAEAVDGALSHADRKDQQ